MKTIPIVIFCCSSLVVMLALSALLYPFARLPDSFSAVNSSAMPIEAFDQVVDMGENFGSMTVVELMGYYLDNPPIPKTGSDVPIEPTRHFGGC